MDTHYTNLKGTYDSLVKLTVYVALEEAIFNNSTYNELHYFRAPMEAHKAVLLEARALENKNYQAGRWNNFLYGIRTAEEAYNNVDATDTDISSALFMLDYFKSELK